MTYFPESSEVQDEDDENNNRCCYCNDEIAWSSQACGICNRQYSTGSYLELWVDRFR